MAEHRVMSEDLLGITHYRSGRCYESHAMEQKTGARVVTLPGHPARRDSVAAGVAPADDDDPFGSEKKPKYKQSRKKMKRRMERAPLISGVKPRLRTQGYR